MTKFEQIHAAKEKRIADLLAINGRDGISITRDRDVIHVEHPTLPIMIADSSDPQGKPIRTKGIEFDISLPAGFPLESKPSIYFRNPKKRPWSPNVFSSGQACIGRFYTNTSLVSLVRKMFLEGILDPSTINPNDAANGAVREQYRALAPTMKLPLIDPREIYRLLPEADGEVYKRRIISAATPAAPAVRPARRPSMA